MFETVQWCLFFRMLVLARTNRMHYKERKWPLLCVPRMTEVPWISSRFVSLHGITQIYISKLYSCFCIISSVARSQLLVTTRHWHSLAAYGNLMFLNQIIRRKVPAPCIGRGAFDFWTFYLPLHSHALMADRRANFLSAAQNILSFRSIKPMRNRNARLSHSRTMGTSRIGSKYKHEGIRTRASKAPCFLCYHGMKTTTRAFMIQYSFSTERQKPCFTVKADQPLHKWSSLLAGIRVFWRRIGLVMPDYRAEWRIIELS